MAYVLNENQVYDVVCELEGTCKSLDGVVSRMFGISEDDLSEETMEQIGKYLFCCGDCGWWHCVDVMNEVDGEYLCEVCYEERVNNGYFDDEEYEEYDEEIIDDDDFNDEDSDM